MQPAAATAMLLWFCWLVRRGARRRGGTAAGAIRIWADADAAGDEFCLCAGGVERSGTHCAIGVFRSAPVGTAASVRCLPRLSWLFDSFSGGVLWLLGLGGAALCAAQAMETCLDFTVGQAVGLY